jgi:L-alanine-DL-glutamate epimerase-like enolase superfamily enzyme
MRAADIVEKKPILNISDLKNFGQEVQESGFKAIKTNIGVFGEEPYIYMPGFYKSSGGPELNINTKLLNEIEIWVKSLRESVGDNIEIALDLNFNFKTEGYIKIGQRLQDYNLMWLEIDSYSAKSLRTIKDSINIPITSCENLYGPIQYNEYFQNYAMDIASIDVIWNGFTDSKIIADIANVHEMNICPHNYNGHLSTFISMHLCSVVPNLRMAEIDVDDVPWRDELFTDSPEIENGYMIMSSKPGWGCDLNESALSKYCWEK